MSDLPPPNVDIEGGINSPSSSTSSFVPIDYKEDAIQVINELKEFNGELLEYIDSAHGLGDISDSYHIVSVFGSQSTGKSTLLNKLFNTNFDVMDEHRRQQTTKGIWMAHSPVVSSNGGKKTLRGEIFVMDVEGTDGRERGEDQDFERKSALFAISTSEVLIVNIWETQIGLYQGANMGLLKTVFEVNLSLFGAAKLSDAENSHKVLLLIVVRDHIGNTPLSNLSTTLTNDLVKMWDDLNKPAELSHLKFNDFFDIDFHALHHKVLQFAEFEQDVKNLGDRFSKANELFKPNYHHNIPIDGWTMYAENCWDQINNNKDLDLPTQQILVAKFKCDEILNTVFEDFVDNYKEKLASTSLIDIVDEYLAQYDAKASRYNTSVYEGRKVILEEKIHEVLEAVYKKHKDAIETVLAAEFSQKVSSVNIANFCDETAALIEELQNEYFSKLDTHKFKREQLLDEDWTKLSAKLEGIIDEQRSIELNNMINKSIKRVNSQMTKLIHFEVNNNPDENTWANILGNFKRFKTDQFEKKFSDGNGTYDFGLGTADVLNAQIVEQFKQNSWNKVYSTLKAIVNKDTLGNIMKERFEDTFRYDESGLPRMYMSVVELDDKFGEGKANGFKALEVLKEITVETPNVAILEQEHDDDDEDDDDEEPQTVSKIIKEADCATISKKFKREIDTQYVETKRAMIQSRSHIPYYVYLVILVLGWNELMIVLRNPLLITLTVLIGGGIYFLYVTNMIGPAQLVAVKMLEEVVAQMKTWLRELVKEENFESPKDKDIEMSNL